jgi:two-component system sensor histidine kinase and response regulator WspE
MSSEPDLSDASLIDLFRAEVETHAEVLSTALLALERTPGDTSRINEMMRAAHSIKGASRVVGVDPAGRVAHFMEDCFVAAQKGSIQLSSGDVDVLLRGVDLLEKISATTKDPDANLEQMFSGPVQDLVALLQGILTGRRESTMVATTPSPTPVAAPPETTALPTESAGGTERASTSEASEITIVFPEILDSVAAEEMRRQILSAMDSQVATIRLDLRATRDLDVKGLAFLAAVPQHFANHREKSLQTAGISIEMDTVLGVTGLGESFGILRDATREAE